MHECVCFICVINQMYQFTYWEHFSSGMVMGLQICKWWRKSRNMSLPYRPGCRNTHSTPRAWWEVKGKLILWLKMDINFVSVCSMISFWFPSVGANICVLIKKKRYISFMSSFVIFWISDLLVYEKKIKTFTAVIFYAWNDVHSMKFMK